MAENNVVNETMETMETMETIVDTMDGISEMNLPVNSGNKFMKVVFGTIGTVAAVFGGVYCYRKIRKKKGQNDEPLTDPEVNTDNEVEEAE